MRQPKGTPRDIDPTKPAHINFTVVALGSRELLGLRPSWDRVVERLKVYSLGQVLEVLGRISIILIRSDFSLRDVAPQARLLRGIFGAGAEVERALGRWLEMHGERGERVPPFVLFHERQLLTAAKAAFLALPVDDSQGLESLAPLGEALLMIGNLIEQDAASVVAVDPDSEEGRNRWEQFLLANTLFNHRGSELHDTTRSYLLYYRDRPYLRARDPSSLNLPDQLESLIGVSPDDLWLFLASLNARWGAMDVEKIHESSSAFEPHAYLVGTGVFTKEEVDGFLHLTSQEAAALKAEIEAGYSFDNIRSYSILPFARRPMIMIGERAYFPSVRLLADKLVRGPHHLLLDAELQPDRKKRKQYLDYMGHLFEDYIRELLIRTYAPAIGRFIPEDAIKEAVTGKCCDGIITVGDTAIFVECKASVLPLSIREGTGWEQYVGRMEDIFVDGAQQLHNTIEAALSGALRSVGLDPARIRKYLPVVVTLEDVPLNPMLYGRLRTRWTEEGLLGQRRVLALQVLDVGEMEIWEAGVSLGRAMHRKLTEKASDPDFVDLSFVNYLYMRGDDTLSLRNPYLLQVHEELFEEKLDLLRARQLASQATQSDANI